MQQEKLRQAHLMLMGHQDSVSGAEVSIKEVSQDVFKAYMDKVKVVTREEASRCSVEKSLTGFEAEKCRDS
jgi:hypothetical protein